MPDKTLQHVKTHELRTTPVGAGVGWGGGVPGSLGQLPYVGPQKWSNLGPKMVKNVCFNTDPGPFERVRAILGPF